MINIKMRGISGTNESRNEYANNAGPLRAVGAQPSFGYSGLAVTAANATGGSIKACSGDQPSGAANGGTNQAYNNMVNQANNDCYYLNNRVIEPGNTCQPSGDCGCPCGGV